MTVFGELFSITADIYIKVFKRSKDGKYKR